MRSVIDRLTILLYQNSSEVARHARCFKLGLKPSWLYVSWNTQRINPGMWRSLEDYHCLNKIIEAQSAAAVEYADCISAEGLDYHPNKCSWYNIKLNQMVKLQSWSLGIWSTPPLLLLPATLCSGVIVSVRVLCMGQIELFNLLHRSYLSNIIICDK